MNFGRLPFFLFHAGYDALAVASQSLLVRLDPKPERRRALQFFRNGARLRAMKWEGVQNYPVYVINRQCDEGRLARFAKSSAKWGVKFERVEAINCADPNFDFYPYDSKIADTFYGRKEFLRGAVGCFLSHAKAWQKLLDSELSYALICEDDVRWLGPIPNQVLQYSMPRDLEILFVHQRLAQGLNTKIPSAGAGFFNWSPVFETACSLIAQIQSITASGGEGYLLSREGAKKILAIFQRRGVYMEVDWLLFFHAMQPEERRKFVEMDGTGRFDMLEFDAAVLKSAVLQPALLEQIGLKSTIAFDNPKNYISREVLRGVSSRED